MIRIREAGGEKGLEELGADNKNGHLHIANG